MNDHLKADLALLIAEYKNKRVDILELENEIDEIMKKVMEIELKIH